MAINDIVQTIAEARVDARSLSEFVFKPAGFKVARRLAPTVDTLQFYINRFNSLNGDFSSSVSVALSSLNSSVAEANGKVAYIESTVQNAINNTAVEGGVLADTFVTVTKKTQKAIARTQAQVNGERVSVKDYGAVGDGVADDTQAFRDAIADALPHTTIYMPKGVYRLTGQLVWKTKLSLVGAGVGVSILKMDGELFDAINATAGRPPTGLNPDGSAFSDPLEYCRFEDFEIDGSGLTYPTAAAGGKGMFMLAMRRCLFRNLYIHHTIGTGLGCDFLDETVIESCNVSYCGRNFDKEGPKIGQSGIGIGTGQKLTESVIVSNCVTNYNGNYGVFVEIQDETLRDWATTGARFVGCYAEGNRHGFGNRASGSTIFLGCHAYKNKENGFYALRTRYGLNTYSACVAELNEVTGFRSELGSGLDSFNACLALSNNSHGFHIYTRNVSNEYIGGEGVRIGDCRAYNNGGTGYVIGSIPIPDDSYRQGYHSIHNSSAVGSGVSGILCRFVQNLNISSCDISSNAKKGLDIVDISKFADYSIRDNRICYNKSIGASINVDQEALMMNINNNNIINNCEAGIVGERKGMTITVRAGSLVRVANNTFVSSNGATKQAVGLETSATDITAKFIVVDNILSGHATPQMFISENTNSSIYANNTGFNDDALISSLSLAASPAQLPVKPYPVRYYINSSSNDVTLKRGGAAFIKSSRSIVFDVPANTSDYTVEYGSSVSAYYQKY